MPRESIHCFIIWSRAGKKVAFAFLRKAVSSMSDLNPDPLPDPLVSLNRISDMLAVHPDFRIVPVRKVPDSMPGLSFVGWAIKEGRLMRFGAAFSGGLTLLQFRISQPEPRTLAMDLQWYCAARRSGQAVFIHFLDRDGALRFQ